MQKEQDGAKDSATRGSGQLVDNWLLILRVMEKQGASACDCAVPL